MLSLVDIKGSINQMLKDKFGYKIYGREVQEGFDRPAFFVELLPIATNLENQNVSSNNLTAIISYFQPIQQDRAYIDLDNIKMYDSLRELFMFGLNVGGRHLITQDIRADYAGNNMDVLQVSFDINFYDNTGRQRDTEPFAANVDVRINNEGGN